MEMIKRNLLFALLLCSALFVQTGLAKSPSFPVTGTATITPFDQRFINLMRRYRVPGASVAIIHNGQLVLSRGYGYADLSARQPVVPDALFRIGSVSKAITAVTVLKLAQEGKFNLEDKVFSLLPDLSPLDHHTNPQIYQITVRNLLQMASGWRTNIIDPMFGPWTMHMLSQLTGLPDEVPPDCETAARLMMDTRLNFRPGTQYSYSNLNYCLLGLLATKKATNTYAYQNYQTYVQQNILAPLGITDMRIGDTLLQNRAPNEVKYYTYPSSPRDATDMVSTMANIDGLPYSTSQILRKNFADGGWIASAPDLAKFAQALGNDKILSAAMLRVMTEKPTYRASGDNYFAMGWSVRHIDGHWYWIKTGSFTGTYAIVIQRDDGWSYVALFNIKPPHRPAFLAQVRQLLVNAV